MESFFQPSIQEIIDRTDLNFLDKVIGVRDLINRGVVSESIAIAYLIEKGENRIFSKLFSEKNFSEEIPIIESYFDCLFLIIYKVSTHYLKKLENLKLDFSFDGINFFQLIDLSIKKYILTIAEKNRNFVLDKLFKYSSYSLSRIPQKKIYYFKYWIL